jgi:hypothetical protein
MPDLATALKNAINNINTKEKQMNTPQITHSQISNIVNEWDNDPAKDAGQHKAHTFPVSNNVTRATFECVKANPGLRQARIAEIMEAQGYKRDSVCTLMVQMAKVGIMRRSEAGVYFINQDEYSPIKISHLKAARRAEKKVKQSKVATPATRSYVKSGKYTQKDTGSGIAALGTQAKHTIAVANNTPAAPLTQSVTNFDADQLLSALSFNQAIALYKKLKAMLGEI